MYNQVFKTILIVLLIMLSSGCSGNTPITTGDIDRQDLMMPVPGATVPGNGLLGIWHVELDLDKSEWNQIAARDALVHYNVESFLPEPEIYLNSFDSVTNIADVDMSIWNRTSLIGYDLRVIFYTDCIGHELLNANGWTGLFDIPGGLPINPFKAFAIQEPNRQFAAHTVHWENLQILLPGGNPLVTFAIEASYPGNCNEPYEIDNYLQGYLMQEPGSVATVEINVYDWQDNTNLVSLYCPEITGVDFVPFAQINPELWRLSLVNNSGASAGEYTGYIQALSSDSSGIALYDRVTVLVRDEIGWTRSWGGNDEHQGNQITLDYEGNILVSGWFEGTADFDPGSETDMHSSNGDKDMYVSKFDSDGNFIWAKTWGGTLYDVCTPVKADHEGNVIVTGFFQSILADFDPGPGISYRSSNGGDDIFVLKLDPDGNFLWAHTWGSPAPGEKGEGVAIDESNNVFVGGMFFGIVDFDPGVGTETRISQGEQDIFCSKFTPDGEFIEVLTIGSSGNDACWDLYIDNPESLYISGNFSENVDFDPGAPVEIHTSVELTDCFLSRYDTNFNYSWTRTWGGPDYQVVRAVETDPAGDVFVAGYFKGSADFDPSSGVYQLYSNGDYDAFLTKYTPEGDFLWAHGFGGVGEDTCWSASCDSFGNVVLQGDFMNIVDFDPGPGQYTQEAKGVRDIYISKFNGNGDFIWTRCFGNTGGDSGKHLTVSDSGDIYATGSFWFEVDFDPGPLEDIHIGDNKSSYLINLRENGYY